jgi:prevent-host-death family protein
MENRQLHNAKHHFSALVRKAEKKGPQTITIHGKATAVLLSINDYRTLLRNQESLTEFFQHSPLMGVELELERGKTVSREVVL